MKCIEIPNFGLRFVVENELEEYRANSVFEKEPETIEWINQFDEGAVFFDVGANIGIYSLYSACRHSDLSIYTFEPVSNNYSSLLRNIWKNNFENVKPFHFAISNNIGLTKIFLSDLRCGNSGAQINAAIDDKGNGYDALRVEHVLSVSIDYLIYNLGFPVPGYVKIDVDGYESNILDGMSHTLSSDSLRSILVEFNNQDQFEYWKSRLSTFGLRLDHAFDNVPNHSGIRRKLKGSSIRNYIFSKIE